MGLFEALYAAGEAVRDAAKKPFVKSSLKRKFQSAYEDCETKRIDLDKKVHEFMAKFDQIDLNAVIEAELDKKTLLDEQEILKAKYKEMFDKELKSNIDPD